MEKHKIIKVRWRGDELSENRLENDIRIAEKSGLKVVDSISHNGTTTHLVMKKL